MNLLTAKIEARRRVRAALVRMPALSHWPLKPAPFRNEDSEVLRFIVALFPQHHPDAAELPEGERFREAYRILCTSRWRFVLFNRRRRLWHGKERKC